MQRNAGCHIDLREYVAVCIDSKVAFTVAKRPLDEMYHLSSLRGLNYSANAYVHLCRFEDKQAAIHFSFFDHLSSSNMILIKKRPFAHVYLNPQANAMVHQWQQQIDADTYQEMLSDMLETFADLKQDYPGLGWICDNTKTPNVASASRFWKDNSLDAELMAAGLHHAAIVVDRRTFDGLNEKAFERELPGGTYLQVQYFGDLVAAQNWLASNAKQAVA